MILAVLSGPGLVGAATTINISGMVNGANVQIGTLTDNIANGANPFETGTFQLGAAYIPFMNNAAGQQFRYVQILTADSSPGKFPNGTAVTVPYVDPVSGGYNYQQPGGDDTFPFFEANDGQPNGGYPTYSGTFQSGANANASLTASGLAGMPIHSDANGTVLQWDAPGNFTATFITYITYENTALATAKQFDVLGGFTWTDTGGTYAGGADAGAINAAALTQLNTGLANSGFAGWSAITAYAIPEPSTLVLVGLGMAVCLAGRRRLAA